MRTPVFRSDVFYARTSEWACLCGEYVRVGIDDYSQSALGDIVFIELPQAGSTVQAGISFGSLEATKAVSDINAPVSGRVVRVNQAVLDSPDIINADPFGEGWLIDIAPSDLDELAALMNADSYKAYLQDGALR